ncbi:hypothetical protein ABK040_001553 [Willaertia magna]
MTFRICVVGGESSSLGREIVEELKRRPNQVDQVTILTFTINDKNIEKNLQDNNSLLQLFVDQVDKTPLVRRIRLPLDVIFQNHLSPTTDFAPKKTFNDNNFIVMWDELLSLLKNYDVLISSGIDDEQLIQSQRSSEFNNNQQFTIEKFMDLFLMDIVEGASISRFVPKDFTVDYRNLQSNICLQIDLRKDIWGECIQRNIPYTSIINGLIMDFVFSGTPKFILDNLPPITQVTDLRDVHIKNQQSLAGRRMRRRHSTTSYDCGVYGYYNDNFNYQKENQLVDIIDWERNYVKYVGTGKVNVDVTCIEDIAHFTVEMVTTCFKITLNKHCLIVGDQFTLKELANTLASMTGINFKPIKLANIEDNVGDSSYNSFEQQMSSKYWGDKGISSARAVRINETTYDNSKHQFYSLVELWLAGKGKINMFEFSKDLKQYLNTGMNWWRFTDCRRFLLKAKERGNVVELNNQEIEVKNEGALNQQQERYRQPIVVLSNP